MDTGKTDRHTGTGPYKQHAAKFTANMPMNKLLVSAFLVK